jgi:hypothetical protein
MVFLFLIFGTIRSTPCMETFLDLGDTYNDRTLNNVRVAYNKFNVIAIYMGTGEIRVKIGHNLFNISISEFCVTFLGS